MSESPAPPPFPTLDERFHRTQQLLREQSESPLLHKPLAFWVQPNDRHLPQALLRKTVGDLLHISFEELRMPGVGDRRLEKLLEVLERSQRAIARAAHPGETSASVSAELLQRSVEDISQDAEEVCEDTWQQWCEILRRHRLAGEPMGRFASSLSSLPQVLWEADLGTYTSKTLAEIRTLPNHGTMKISQVVEVVARLARLLVHVSPDKHIGVRVVPVAIRDVTSWLEETLHSAMVPDLHTIRAHFVEPLMSQLAIDLLPEVAAMVRRRIGIETPPETLVEIAVSVGLTPQRVQQLATRAVEALQVRWPEGKYVLDDFYALLQEAPDAQEQLELVRRVLDCLFAVPFSRGSSRKEVLAAWDRAGRSKHTPMTEQELSSWLAGEFPHLSHSVAGRWLAEDGLRYDADGGRVLYFSNDPVDRLLHRIYVLKNSIHITEAAEIVQGEERNVRVRLERDFRFLEDEYKRVHAAELCSFLRSSGTWHVRLAPGPAGKASPRADSIAIHALVHLVVGGLLQARIADATVWGVHRYANEVLTRLYGAVLPADVTPFIIASMLSRHSGGTLCHMRRRRLRWDCADSSIPIRGKRGWVQHVVSEANVPMTMEELGIALRRFYQDYAEYVVQQLRLDDADEEGIMHCTARIIPGVPGKLPTLVIPRDWELHVDRGNVSDGIRMLAAEIVSGSRGLYERRHLRRIPWLITLCEHSAYGNLSWSDDEPGSDNDTDEAEGMTKGDASDLDDDFPTILGGQNNARPSDAVDNTDGRQIADLLERFL